MLQHRALLPRPWHQGNCTLFLVSFSCHLCVNTHSGINRALRSSVRDSRATDTPDDLSDLGDDQNLLELHLSEATLYVSTESLR